jgi:hypothetical protein
VVPALHHLLGIKERAETLPPSFPKREFSLAKPDLDRKIRVVRVEDDAQSGGQSRAGGTLNRKRPLESLEKGFSETHQGLFTREPGQGKTEHPLADDPQKIQITNEAL